MATARHTNQRRDATTPQREDVAAPAQQANASTVSGLYRLSVDNKLPYVHRAEHTTGSAASELDDQEYADPEIFEDTAATLLGGPHIREDLRLDVDGHFPQMTASGAITRWLTGRIHWIARLRPTGRFSWSGHIWFREGATQLFPYTNVNITVSRSAHAHQRRATVKFTGGGAPPRLRGFRYSSAHFREVAFEFDYEQGVEPIVAIDTTAHPNCPPSLPSELLSIESVFRRAGFRTTRSSENAVLPAAPSDTRWSDLEMHDAMQAHWSRNADRPQWALWTFFASQHEMGPSLGGVMFDDIGPQHRQGTALFYNSFISQAPANDAAPDAWINRMRFWTAVHEMGHAFNLSHSWQKSLVFNGNGPWIPLADEPEGRTFMNYPYNVAGGQTAFFSDFEFRFSDSELLFMRHAPERFVQMGNAEWFDHHGFEQTNVSVEPTLQLQVRVNRDRPVFSFLEPVVLELKLKNIGNNPQLIPDDLITNGEGLTIIVKRQGDTARLYQPYASYLRKPGQTVLRTGQSLYSSLFVAAGRGGWTIAEPGSYLVQVCLHRDDEDILSAPLMLRVMPAQQREETVLAQDFFSDAVGRTLAFDGTRFLTQANDTLREAVARLPNHRLLQHAMIALRLPDMRSLRAIDATEEGMRLRMTGTDQDAARRDLDYCLNSDANTTAETLGHVDYNDYVNRYVDLLESQGTGDALISAEQTLRTASETLERRGALPEIVLRLAKRAQEISRTVKAAPAASLDLRAG